MLTDKLFQTYSFTFSGRWEDWFALLLVAALLVLIIQLYQAKQQSSTADVAASGATTYSSKLAWLRGGIYFCVCFLLSWATGVLKTITRSPLATSEQLGNGWWWLATAVCLIVILVAYAVIWPKGTLTHGRPLDLTAVIPFGLLWGLSEGQLFLSIWALVERLPLATVWVAIISFIIISGFKGAWHSQYWDIYVSPEHNIEEWNGRKVLFCHVPNLIITLSFLAFFGNAALFVVWQTIGLLSSTYFMHFPSPQQL
ncbi:MAG: hypothetical protein AAF614_06380 [Chloroflexota bacterium]